MSVNRCYSEKKPGFDVEARSLFSSLHDLLEIKNLTHVRYLCRYDTEGLAPETYEKAKGIVFSEPMADVCYDEDFPRPEGAHTILAVEPLPGQFDQRADSCAQCIQLLTGGERPTVAAAKIYVLEGELTAEDMDKIRGYLINPVDTREASMDKPATLKVEYAIPTSVASVVGFTHMDESALSDLLHHMGLAMDLDDLKFLQTYFRDTEKRDPTITEVRMVDTYWSDHCRHTTFLTQIDDVKFEDQMVQDAFDRYMAARVEVYGEEKAAKRPVTLMDMGTIAAKVLKKRGYLKNIDESEEINACSIKVKALVNGHYEDWLLMFKNETHNHPTEIEPFGGAATCLGGAIRDPLSGRTYVYQAMRVTGAADPTRPQSETLEGKLPQKKLVREAAHGYSSYGNQIGLATGYVKEVYHPDYVAKRMEIGAVLGAAPRRAVVRENSDPGDIIILLGGRTGRDGCGGATGSSKVHTTESIETCGAEVQKGNAPTERKLQRLFRREEVSLLIKKCNDFGAGGVSVAIGELAPGLKINLDKVPKKYAGLDGTEIAISESQERMAVVIDPKDREQFLKYAAEENLEATEVAVVTEDPRLVLSWRGKEIVNISRAFLDTNGAHQENDVFVEIPKAEDTPLKRSGDIADVKEKWLSTLSDLNACSQKGLVEMFDSSIGAASVLMPYGGKYQLTETQAMVAKVPVPDGKTNTVTMMSYGFDPYVSSWSPYHGAVYAVTESLSRIVAVGGDYSKVRFTFQEYFRRMTEDPHRWSQPFAALLGAYDAQMGYGLPSIGGKDSMSGTFNHIDVPPTLVSFAVDVAKLKDVVSPELKNTGDKLVWIHLPVDAHLLPEYEGVMETYRKLHEDMQNGRVKAAYVVDRQGIAAAVSKMAFGNALGVTIEHNVDERDLFTPYIADLICEVPAEKVGELASTYTVIGEVTDKPVLSYKNTEITIREAVSAWNKPLEKVFKTVSGAELPEVDALNVAAADENGIVADSCYQAKSIHVCSHKLAQPTVFIPVFPGTNCEYDSTRAFERAGAKVITQVFSNLSAEDIRGSVDAFEKVINQAQIIMFPGGFSAGDEPDGSAKFFATAFQNAKIKEAVTKLLNERDGLALGICNGFQALIKLGLVPYGEILGQTEDSPTLTFNTIGRHISKMVYTKVVTNKSPWLAGAELGGVYTNPASHGEGRFVASKEWIDKLMANGQIATRYCDVNGNLTNDEYWNVNGSYCGIEGITSPDGRVFGKMAHAERRDNGVAVNIYGEQDLKIFESGVAYFK